MWKHPIPADPDPQMIHNYRIQEEFLIGSAVWVWVARFHSGIEPETRTGSGNTELQRELRVGPVLDGE